MISHQIDIGQIVISILLLLVSIICWFLKKDIEEFGKRIDRHDVILFEMAGSVNRLIGYYEAFRGKEKE